VGGSVQRRACYLALGVTVEGERDVLGMWFQETEGAKFWMQVLAELKQRGVRDILICCVDGLKGFPEAIEAIFPKTVVQTCVVHLIRHSLKYVPRREREQVARDLKPVYTAVDADAAQQALEAFDEKWGKRFPVITQAWLDAWEYVTPFLAFPPEVRRVIYTTNAIEALNRQLRKAIKTKGHFPNEEAARKLIYLAVTNAVPAWTRTPQLDDSTAGVQDPLRRPPTRLNRLHSKSDTLRCASVPLGGDSTGRRLRRQAGRHGRSFPPRTLITRGGSAGAWRSSPKTVRARWRLSARSASRRVFPACCLRCR
jgi:hypothetical protein